MLGVNVDCSPACMLLNDDSEQNFNHTPGQLWLSACTVTKKMVAVGWQQSKIWQFEILHTEKYSGCTEKEELKNEQNCSTLTK